MAIPIESMANDTFLSVLNDGPNADLLQGLISVLQDDSLLVGRQICPKTKAESFSRYALVKTFIDAFCNKWEEFRGGS